MAESKAKAEKAEDTPQDVIAQAEAKAAEIIAAAEAKAAEIAPETGSTETEVRPDTGPAEETVKIKLMKDDQRYKDDVHVVVNGRVYVIQRGVEVEVPKYVAEVIENSMAQQAAAYDYSDRLSREFESESARRGI